VSYKLTKPH